MCRITEETQTHGMFFLIFEFIIKEVELKL